jgi:hypothetical protein
MDGIARQYARRLWYRDVVAQFFKIRKPPVDPQETLELMTFMEAADESKRQGGGPVKLADIFSKAEAQARAKSDSALSEKPMMAGTAAPQTRARGPRDGSCPLGSIF